MAVPESSHDRSWSKESFQNALFSSLDKVNVEMTAMDLQMLRRVSTHPSLVVFLDKIQLKAWCLERGIRIPHLYHYSSTSSEVPEGLLSMRSFVAKPAHLADSSYIYVMREGINLINGKRTSAEEIQQGLRTAFATTNKNDWATENAHPGVMVEELIEPSGDRSSNSTPDELKCHAVWGELFFCQWVWVSHMNPDVEQVRSHGEFINQGHLDFGFTWIHLDSLGLN